MRLRTINIRRTFTHPAKDHRLPAWPFIPKGKTNPFTTVFGSRLSAFILLLAFSLFTSQSTAQEKPNVVATASMIADMAQQIGSDKINVACIVPIGGDPHLHEPTPRDAKLVSKADLLLMNGLTFEGWLTELIENAGTNAPTILVTKDVQPIESLKYKNSTDPHAWMDASNGLIYIKNIRDALTELDPSNKSFYNDQYNRYRQQLEETDQYIKTQIQTIPEERRILITSHDAFQYYGRRYGIRLEAAMGISTDVDVQTSDMVRLNKVIKSSGVPAIFMESTINPKLLKQLAADNDIVIGGELYADSIGDEDSPAPTYLDMLRHNTDVIVSALTQEKSKGEKPNDSGAREAGSTVNNWWLLGVVGLLCLGGFLLVMRKLNN